MKATNNKTLAIVSVALSMMLILGAFTATWLLSRDAAPASAQSDTNSASKPPQITVVGTGSISVKPDAAKVTVGVAFQESTVADAQSKVDTAMAAIIAKLKQAGIAEKDYRTTQYNVEPVMSFDNPKAGSGGALSGFRVINMIEITLLDPSQAASLLDSLVSAGANTIYGINFYVSDTNTVAQQAYDQAVQDARTRAEKIAALSNLNLGKIVSVSETGIGGGVPMYDKAMGMGGGANGVAPGQQTIQISLVVTYEANAK